jgi:hypothetical protein
MIISNLTVILKDTSQLEGYRENTRRAPSISIYYDRSESFNYFN